MATKFNPLILKTFKKPNFIILSEPRKKYYSF